jgi:hypothetical protein
MVEINKEDSGKEKIELILTVILYPKLEIWN